MTREILRSERSEKRRTQIKRRDPKSRARFETEVYEIEASGPFCALPSHFFERSLELANSRSSHQAGIVFEDLRGRAR